MQRYAGKTFVIKYGGHAMIDDEIARVFARDIVLIKQVGINPIVVHGGGPQIAEMLDRLQIKSSFVDGLRVTDAATVEVVEMVLAGKTNKQIVSAICQAGGSALGLSGKDAGLMLASRVQMTKNGQTIDLGFVGDPVGVDADVLRRLALAGFIPVIAPIGYGRGGETYNVNADTAAGAVAGAVEATRLLMLTDVPGVLDKDGNLLTDLTVSQVARVDEGRHHQRRHDPEAADLPGRAEGRGRGGRDSRRARAPCPVARDLHRPWRRHAGPARLAERRSVTA